MSLKNKSNEYWDEIELDDTLVKNSFKLAQRDLETAKNMLEQEDYDWAFAISYNAMLQGGRALMFSRKVRPKGEYKHVSVIKFVESELKGKFTDRILYMFNKMRKKRHMVVYELPDTISKNEAEEAIEVAEEFVKEVAKLLK